MHKTLLSIGYLSNIRQMPFNFITKTETGHNEIVWCVCSFESVCPHTHTHTHTISMVDAKPIGQKIRNEVKDDWFSVMIACYLCVSCHFWWIHTNMQPLPSSFSLFIFVFFFFVVIVIANSYIPSTPINSLLRFSFTGENSISHRHDISTSLATR